MSYRTDLALELHSQLGEETEGVEKKEKRFKNTLITKIRITSKQGEEKIGRPMGNYITVEFGDVEKITDYSEIKIALSESLKALVPKPENILVVGLGNSDITADSIGPATAARLLATRHIAGEFAEQIGLKGLKKVSVVTPNVLGKTGVEVAELVEGVVSKIKPQAVIVIDACVSGSINRLFRTIQLCDTGIAPGSGVKNSRKELSQKNLGVPVIAVGIPTVVEALTLAFELSGKEPEFNSDMVVTPKDADLLVHRISELLASALNEFLQPEISSEILSALV